MIVSLLVRNLIVSGDFKESLLLRLRNDRSGLWHGIQKSSEALIAVLSFHSSPWESCGIGIGYGLASGMGSLGELEGIARCLARDMQEIR